MRVGIGFDVRVGIYSDVRVGASLDMSIASRRSPLYDVTPLYAHELRHGGLRIPRIQTPERG